MDLVKSILTLRFSVPGRPWMEMRETLRVAGGDPAAELRASPIVLDQPEQRQRVVIHVRAITLEEEGTGSGDERRAHAVDLMTRMNHASEFPPITRLRYECIFIEPYPLPFHELFALMKGRLLGSNAFLGSATDFGLILDEHEQDIVKHTQVGPMDADQLRSQYLAWPEEGVPQTFVFLGLAYESNKDTQFTPDSLQEFLLTAAAWHLQQADVVLNALRSEGE